MRFELTPGILHDIADAAEADGGCVEGVEFGRTHDISEVAQWMDSTHAYWVLVNYGDQMSAPLQDMFVAAVERHPLSSALAWGEVAGLADEHYQRFEAAAVRVTRWREAGAKPGGRHHLSGALRRTP